jgi:hypothetical protein
MALVHCTKCGHYPVSTTAIKCPRCGAARYGLSTSLAASQPSRLNPVPERRTSSVKHEAAGYAQIAGIVGLSLAIAGLVVPVIGVLFITPLAIILNSIALWGGYKRIGLVTIVIILVNLLISPTFWLNIAASAAEPTAYGNRFLTYFDVAGLLAMFSVVDWRRPL